MGQIQAKSALKFCHAVSYIKEVLKYLSLDKLSEQCWLVEAENVVVVDDYDTVVVAVVDIVGVDIVVVAAAVVADRSIHSDYQSTDLVQGVFRW